MALAFEAQNCDVFLNKHPSTISMSVLVVVEMFNALNNLSEDASLLRVRRPRGFHRERSFWDCLLGSKP